MSFHPDVSSSFGFCLYIVRPWSGISSSCKHMHLYTMLNDQARAQGFQCLCIKVRKLWGYIVASIAKWNLIVFVIWQWIVATRDSIKTLLVFHLRALLNKSVIIYRGLNQGTTLRKTRVLNIATVVLILASAHNLHMQIAIHPCMQY